MISDKYIEPDVHMSRPRSIEARSCTGVYAFLEHRRAGIG